jgi:hypothetical protein
MSGGVIRSAFAARAGEESQNVRDERQNRVPKRAFCVGAAERNH